MPSKAFQGQNGTNVTNGMKRKDPPSSNTSNPSKDRATSRGPKRTKIQDARTILAQNAEAALSNGELNLNAFLKAREFEIKALEDGMTRAKSALTTRAFQQLPREMRRRTASHDVKRVPKRLQKRAAREMKDDNTPTVVASKRRPSTSRGRLRAETAKRLGLLAGRKRAAKEGTENSASKAKNWKDGVDGRVPRPKATAGVLKMPSKPPSKFRRRQIHKTWLPTHMYHAKRAKMTEPKNPFYRFAVPITATEKCYRSTHRANGGRGALCWDMSYMSTIGLEGSTGCLEKVLRAVGITQSDAWDKRGQKWRDGKRTWIGWLSKDEKGRRSHVAPATVIWSASERTPAGEILTEGVETESVTKPPKRKLFIRIHPSAFLGLWNELLRISKMQRPSVHCEDLRFEIGSIELTGPGCTEALVGILHPYDDSDKLPAEEHARIFKVLASVTNSASLPQNSLLTFPIMDPRLRYPPRKLELPRADDGDRSFELFEMLSRWPADQSIPSAQLFNRNVRHNASRFPSQKSLNRRKAAAAPGEFAQRLPTDPSIPILLYTSRGVSSGSTQGSWTLLAPWKCVLPIWYGLMHFPLSSGGNPRFGGLQELQQINFEHGKPWFPGDFPGTDAGWLWEVEERARRKKEWDARPKGKRTHFDSLDLGAGRRGEIGSGWACDFEWFSKSKEAPKGSNGEEMQVDQEEKDCSRAAGPEVEHLPSPTFQSLLSDPKLDAPTSSIATVHITLFSRGVPQTCARIYRLPYFMNHSSEENFSKVPPHQSTSTYTSKPTFTSKSLPTNLRAQWLALASSTTKSNPKNKSRNRPAKPLSDILKLPPSLQHRALAQSLLPPTPLPYPATKPAEHPVVPDEEDLIGFVTSGGYNLAKGVGTAIGGLCVQRVVEGLKLRKAGGREVRMCIVRNVGESVGRLGIWEVA